MARGAASPCDDGSSSGFSSDEEMVDVSDLPSAASHTRSVRVQVLDEAEETEPNPSAISAPGTSTASTASSAVLQCCQEAADPILQTLKPLDVPYEQFTAAIGHVTWHWPTSETFSSSAELENRLQAYHSLRAELYKTFQRTFPLTEDMYAQWVSDASARGDAVDEIQELFELAQGDYWSVSLTLQYMRFVKENGDEQGLDIVMDKAQRTLGTHFARGHEVWALCRELTTEKYDEKDDGKDVEREKETAVRELFCKQMQLPLDQNDLVMSEFRAWDAYNTLDAAASGSAFEEASKRQSKVFAPLMKKLRGFEAAISAAPGTEEAATPEQAWQQYLNFVKHRVAPLVSSEKDGASDESGQLVVCLYERAVSAMCLSSTLWASYLEYLEPDQATGSADKLKGGEKLAVARRAVRNVPFDSSAWTELLIEMERQSKPAEKVSQFVRADLLERSIPPMDQFHLLSVLLTWCDSVRRHASTSIDGESLESTVRQVELLVGGVFAECEQFLTKAFPDFLDGDLRLAEYQAKCYWALMPPVGSPRRTPATAMKVSKVNELWKNTLNTPLGDQAAAWIAYLDALRRMNAFSVESIRTMVFDEAVQRVKDAPIVLAESWLVFERENGDLTNYLRSRRYHAKHRATAQAAPSQRVIYAASSTHSEGGKKAKNAKKRKSNATEGNKQAKNSQKPPAAKRAKPTITNSEEGNATAMEVDETKAPKSTEKVKVHESLTNEHTLFLCNVSKEACKGDIEALFKDVSTLKDVRLVVKMRGDRVKSRGMAYVQFSDDAGVEAGLKMDGVLLHGHPLRVERSKPPPTSASTAAGKSSGGESFWKTDPLTLYIGNLNRVGSKEQVTVEQLQASLQQAMQTAGELVVVNRVSILKDRHGKLKNYGLVEVAEPPQVAFCLANVAALQAKLGEQVTMKPSRFSIAHILEQQEKQQMQKQQRKSGAAGSAGRGGAASKSANAPHTRPSTRLALPSSGSAISLMPRALRRKLAAQNNAPKTEPAEAAASTANVPTPKSNEDFRKMLFNK
ncbi:Squamous cell carcinoma antigen recognized by T-cells 3 [Phytophthora pseudosyringae]|uniref:Squamous cell carcinoma antigen recognized by T-cells 3 n=1 Tax=Phytophthora pseudosyringae TaxID=221518 RepID=A0A8T1VW28_9STRA|nr:Squamous cell carcinoma antigen recognized by T-cells 3 [Phytophthora pseudosyringae]